MDHTKYLKLALDEARKTFEAGNVPIGAVLVNGNGDIIAIGVNETKTKFDTTAHAEVQALRDAGKLALEKYYSEPTWMYTTLEPCFACSFFITRSNVKHVVWALSDPFAGGTDDLLNTEKLGDKIKALELISEPDAECRKESSLLMQEYYKKKGDLETGKLFV